MIDESCGYALISTPEWTSGIRYFCEGEAGSWLVEPGEFSITGLAWTGDYLVFTDNNGPPGGICQGRKNGCEWIIDHYRITSYNVCYTKLLRPDSANIGSDRTHNPDFGSYNFV